MVNIYNYTDFRKYLQDYFKEQKHKNSFFSHRFLCQKLGLKSSNFMLLVMQGKRNLSKDMATKLPTVLKHSLQETEYFENLVYFTQARNYREKDMFWAKMIELNQRESFSKLDEAQYEYYSNWYNVPIREILPYMDLPLDYKQLSKYLIPAITPHLAKQSVDLLLKLGLIEERMNGFKKKFSIVKTENVVDSLGIFNYHLKMSTMATDFLINYTSDVYNISSCTLELSNDGYNRVVEALSEFREKMMNICVQQNSINRIYQLNLQLFPVTTELSPKKTD